MAIFLQSTEACEFEVGLGLARHCRLKVMRVQQGDKLAELKVEIPRRPPGEPVEGICFQSISSSNNSADRSLKAEKNRPDSSELFCSPLKFFG